MGVTGTQVTKFWILEKRRTPTLELKLQHDRSQFSHQVIHIPSHYIFREVFIAFVLRLLESFPSSFSSFHSPEGCKFSMAFFSTATNYPDLEKDVED